MSERRVLLLAYGVTQSASIIESLYALDARQEAFATQLALDRYAADYARAKGIPFPHLDETFLIVADARAYVTEHQEELDALLNPPEGRP